LATVPAWAAEPLAGLWRLTSQEIDGQKSDVDRLTLKIVPSGGGFAFAYSVPEHDIQFVSLSFSSRLDGAESDVKDAQGNKIGTIKVARAGASQYTAVLQGPNRPSASSKLTVSADGKTLSFATDSKAPGHGAVHTTQVFERLQ
jgi:hypothetical protein